MQLRDKAEYEYEEVVTGHINDFRDKRRNLGARVLLHNSSRRIGYQIYEWPLPSDIQEARTSKARGKKRAEFAQEREQYKNFVQLHNKAECAYGFEQRSRSRTGCRLSTILGSTPPCYMGKDESSSILKPRISPANLDNRTVEEMTAAVPPMPSKSHRFEVLSGEL
jgi:hypothetical protein